MGGFAIIFLGVGWCAKIWPWMKKSGLVCKNEAGFKKLLMGVQKYSWVRKKWLGLAGCEK